MKRLFFFILPVLLFLGCEMTEEPMEGQTSQTASSETIGMGQEGSSEAMELGAIAEDVMDQVNESQGPAVESAASQGEEMTSAKIVEDKIRKESKQQSGMIASVPDGERERIINENRWGYSVRNLDAGSTMYYDRNGNFLGKRLQ